MKIAYLGPKHTFSEQAARSFASDYGGAELIPLVPLASVVRSLTSSQNNRSDAGVMPYYNYVDGVVQVCLDLIYRNNLQIISASRIPVEHAIGAHPENTDDSKILSHEKALGQCSIYLGEKYPNSELIEVGSTAAAAELVKERKSGLAIANIDALIANELEILGKDIGNQTGGTRNYTDFFLVGLENGPPYKEGTDYLTMTSVTPHVDRVGLLRDVLSTIATYGLNNAKIHSRPAIDEVNIGSNGEPQMFYIEIMAHKDSEAFRNCMRTLSDILKPKGKDVEVVRVLGSYRILSLS